MTATAMPASTNAGRDERMVALVERAPVSAVDEQQRAARASGRETGRASASGRRRSANRAAAKRAATASRERCRRPAREPLRVVGNGRAVVVSRARRIPRVRAARIRARQSRCRDDLDGESRPGLDAAHRDVAGDDRAHARGRAGEYQVAGQQLVVLRQEMQHVRDVPDHVGKIALLPAAAVDVER